MKHSELPWSVGKMLSGQPAIDCENYHLAALHRIQEHGENDVSFANAAFIVKAVNNHESLFEALKDLMANNGGGKKFCGHDFTCNCAWEKATSALKEAE